MAKRISQKQAQKMLRALRRLLNFERNQDSTDLKYLAALEYAQAITNELTLRKKT